jgi:hypothetical protein
MSTAVIVCCSMVDVVSLSRAAVLTSDVKSSC